MVSRPTKLIVDQRSGLPELRNAFHDQVWRLGHLVYAAFAAAEAALLEVGDALADATSVVAAVEEWIALGADEGTEP